MAERRTDPTNPPGSKKTYTRQQFLEFYGAQHGPGMWKKAGKAAKSAGKPAPAKKGKGPKVSLHYWDGRGLMEVPRMLLALRGKYPGDDYLDDRYTRAEQVELGFQSAKNTPIGDMKEDVQKRMVANLGRLPILAAGGASVGQSAAINYYLATELGFMGSTTLEAARVISILESLKEMQAAFRGVVGMPPKIPEEADLAKWFDTGAEDVTGAADGKARAERFAKWWLGRIEAVVGPRGFAVGNSLTLADVMIFYICTPHVKDEKAASPCYSRDQPPMGSTERMAAALAGFPKLAKICANVGSKRGIQKWKELRGEVVPAKPAKPAKSGGVKKE